jgi:hypothetical protein
MPKDKSLGTNPALKFHKENKRNLLKKVKAERASARDAKLQQRRPDQIQAQINELKALESAGKINATDKRLLESLEHDLHRLRRLRASGKSSGTIITSDNLQRRAELQAQRSTRLPKVPQRSVYYDAVFNPTGAPPPGMPYKEIADEEESDSGGSTSSSVANIPMPSGTPPPLPQRAHNQLSAQSKARQPAKGRPGRVASTDATTEVTKSLQAASPVQTIYSAAPVLRDLIKDSARFVPSKIKRSSKDNAIEVQAPTRAEVTSVTHPAEDLSPPAIDAEEHSRGISLDTSDELNPPAPAATGTPVKPPMLASPSRPRTRPRINIAP